MSSLRFVLGLLLGCVLCGGVAACGGGGSGEVRLDWQAPDETEGGFDANLKDAPLYDTMVYVTNDTGSTIRDASLRFKPSETPRAPLGLSVGTVTSAPTTFEGASHLWRVGDLAPGSKVAFPLGLWFSVRQELAASESLDFRVELVSPDLAAAVESNPLTVRLTP